MCLVAGVLLLCCPNCLTGLLQQCRPQQRCQSGANVHCLRPALLCEMSHCPKQHVGFCLFCWAAGGGYLANMQPSEWAARFEQRLPEAVSGAAFLEQYGTHWDSATSIDLEQVGCFSKPDFRSLLGLSGKLVPISVNKPGCQAPCAKPPVALHRPADVCSAHACRPSCARKLSCARLSPGEGP